MGASNQEMVNNVHLNRRGFQGDGIAYFFKLEIPQKRYYEISALVVSDQSGRMYSESGEIALPAVNETVCKYYNKHLIPILNAPILRRDNFFANLTHKMGSINVALILRAREVPYPLPHPLPRCRPPQKYFPEKGLDQ